MVVQAQLEVMVVSKVDRLEVRQEQLVGMMVHLMNVVVVVGGMSLVIPYE